MKKLIIVAIALFTLNVSATEKPIKPNEVLRSEIVEIIGPNYTNDFNNKTFTIEVLFTINSKSEIIVLSANFESKNHTFLEGGFEKPLKGAMSN